MKIFIYKIYFPESNKCYIGQTVNINRRMFRHLKTDSAVGRALNRYDYEILPLHVCTTYETANQLEILAIQQHNSVAPNGYNITEGGRGSLGLSGDKHPMFGKKRPDTTKRNKGNKYGLGHKHTDEWKKQQGERAKGNTYGRAGKGIKKPGMSKYMRENNPMKDSAVVRKNVISHIRNKIKKLKQELLEYDNDPK